MPSEATVTLNDIALKLGISKVAVSKALRDHPDISALTKQKVRAAAAAMGYLPNYMARNLSARKTQTLGLVVPKIAHHFFAEAIEAIYAEADANNYEIIMAVSRESEEHERRQIKTMLSMRVDGLLISVSENTRDKSVFEEIRKHGRPLVFFDRVMEGVGFSCVTTADRDSACQAVDAFAARGFRKIAHIAGGSRINIGLRRRQGYEQAMTRRGLTPQLVESGLTEEDGAEGMRRLYQEHGLPEVVFAVTFPVALGAVRVLEEMGVSVPGEVEILSFGGSVYSDYLKPALNYIRQPVTEIGTAATRLLLDEINDGGKKPGLLELPGELILRDNLKRADEDE